MQAMASALAGDITPSSAREYGHGLLVVNEPNPLLPLGDHQVWMSHGDQITQLPPGFSGLATTENTPIAAMDDSNRHYYGVQFHPEVKHTPIGSVIIKNFLFKICQVQSNWTVWCKYAIRVLSIAIFVQIINNSIMNLHFLSVWYVLPLSNFNYILVEVYGLLAAPYTYFHYFLIFLPLWVLLTMINIWKSFSSANKCESCSGN